MSEGKLKFTPEQEAAITYRGGALLVSAAAGSGKTKVLVERLLSRIKDGDDIDEFLIITYTRAAAAELRERIYDEILERLEDAPENRRLRRQSLLCRGASIDTIHGFCTDILRENAHLTGLPPDFRVADESESDIIKAEVLDDVLNAAYETIGESEGFSALTETISAGHDDKRLVRIILDAHAKLQSNPDPRAWTQTQIERLPLENVSDISETIWGAQLMEKTQRTARFWRDEMLHAREEFRALPDFDRAYGATFEAAIDDIEAFIAALDISWDEAKQHSDIDFSHVKPKRITGYDDLKDIRLRCKAAMKKCAAIFISDSQEHIEDMRAVAPAMKALLELVMEFDEEYSKEKRRRGVTDFSDLEHLTLSLLIDGDTGGKTGLARAISRRFKEIMVDEYQDVNAVQESIFNAVSLDSKNIFMVGDVKQSIYRFRLADPSIFLDKYRRFQKADPSTECASGTKTLLSKNFRSRSGILDAVNYVFERIMSVEFGEMDYTEDERLVCGREDGDCDVAAEFDIIDMSVLEQDEEEENPARTQIEAGFIARRISELISSRYMIPDKQGGKRPVGYSDVVILLRSMRGKAWQYASALTERGIPVDMPGGEGFLETVEISAALSLLSVIDNPMQDIPLAAALRGPVYGFSDDELAEIRAGSQGTGFYEALVKAALEQEEGGTSPDSDHGGDGASSGNDQGGCETSPDSDQGGDGASSGNDQGGCGVSPDSDQGGDSSLHRNDARNPQRKPAGLSEKCAAFLYEIEALREVMPEMPADRFIWHVYNKTGLPGRVGAMHGGEKRRNNLILLADYARRFEQSGYKGLFGFLTYIRNLLERGADIARGAAEPVAASDASNAVRIMSIHKSKGLEFPVVILADTSKRINNADAQQPLVIHPELGAGPMRIDKQRRIEYTTLARMAIQSKLTSEMMAEELRLLYVAMTRAREKLIVTATYRDAEKETEKLSKLSGRNIAPQVLEEIKNMAGWILLPLAAEQDVWDVRIVPAELESREPGARDSEPGIRDREPGAWDSEPGIRDREPGARESEPGIRDRKPGARDAEPGTWDSQSGVRDAEAGTRDSEPADASTSAPDERDVQEADPQLIELLRERFSFVYSHARALDLPSKLTVTGLRGGNADSEAAILYPDMPLDVLGAADEQSSVPLYTYNTSSPNNSSDITNTNVHDLKYPTAATRQPDTKPVGKERQAAFSRPSFITKKTGLTAAERGTALHLAMQHVDFAKCLSEVGVSDELLQITKKGLLTEEQAAAVDVRKITRFIKSDIGKRLLKAKYVKREFKFSLLCPAEQFFPGGGDDNILLQGVIDCFFEEDGAKGDDAQEVGAQEVGAKEDGAKEDGALIVVDFKTDHVTADTLEDKVKYYAPQLAAYAAALERITGKRVKERVIYFFSQDKGITL